MRRRRQSRSLGQVIQSYKKVLNIAPTSRAAVTVLNNAITTGVDSTAAGQTSATDGNIPTGSVVKFIEIQYNCQNLVGIAAFLNIGIQQLHSGQTVVDPRVVGGDPQRNQMHFQKQYCIGQNQNVNITLKFKIPKKYQRVREGDTWNFTRVSNQVFTDTMQVIYKFYR